MKDIVVTTIECHNRLILDRDCHFNVPELFADSLLTVDIGGAVNFRATTIDMRNTTIDFTGAAFIGFPGNVCCAGNSWCTKELTISEKSLAPSLLTVEGIQEMSEGQGIGVVGTMEGDFSGTFNGMFSGDLITSHISHMQHDSLIQVRGTLNSTDGYHVDGKQVLGLQQPAIELLGDGASLLQVIEQQNRIIETLRAHGLIAQS